MQLAEGGGPDYFRAAHDTSGGPISARGTVARPSFMKFLTLWFPVVFLIGAIVNTFVPVPHFYEEMGFVENFTVIFLLATMFSLLWYAKGNFKVMPPLDKALLVVMVLGSIYFAGEELSWGQHMFGFEASQEYGKLNYQNETNIHNLEGFYGDLFDKIPRTILTIGILFGGVIFPFIKHRLPELIARYVPGKNVVLVSVLAVFTSVPEKIYKMVAHTKFRSHAPIGGSKAFQARFDGGEMKELYIALFILLFAIFFIQRQKALRAGAGTV